MTFFEGASPIAGLDLSSTKDIYFLCAKVKTPTMRDPIIIKKIPNPRKATKSFWGGAPESRIVDYYSKANVPTTQQICFQTRADRENEISTWQHARKLVNYKNIRNKPESVCRCNEIRFGKSASGWSKGEQRCIYWRSGTEDPDKIRHLELSLNRYKKKSWIRNNRVLTKLELRSLRALTHTQFLVF